jgi:hypothetical protein
VSRRTSHVVRLSPPFTVETGRIEVRFGGVREAVGRLFALAQVLTNDFESLKNPSRALHVSSTWPPTLLNQRETMNYPSVVGACRDRAIGQCNNAACGPLTLLTFAIRNSPITTAAPSRLNEMSSASLVPIQRLSARSVRMIGGAF